MALLSLLFRAAGVRNRIGLLRLDATLTETHERLSRITDHPIELGGSIQDHIQNEPRRLTMEGFVTDTPLGGFSVGTQGAFEILDLTWRTRIPFFVVSGLRVYPLMAFETLTMPKTREGALRFSATMKEINITTTTVVQVAGNNPTDGALSDGNVADTGAQANGVNLGRQTTRVAPPPPQAAGAASTFGGASPVPSTPNAASPAASLGEGSGNTNGGGSFLSGLF